jgi:hypothetical protein
MSRFQDFDNAIGSFFQDFGFTATYVRQVSATPDDTTGVIAVVTESIAVEAIKMELIRPTEGSGSKSGTQIQDGDQILYVRPLEKVDLFASALNINTSADSVIINGTHWRVVTVKRYEPDATNCMLYEFYIRK